jgi:dephospho-CoA kinase
MITIGLTGGICCGKSTVAKTFIDHNIPVISADQVARDVVVPGSLGLEQVIGLFGKKFLLPDGTLNRKTLGDLIFTDKEALRQIDAIMGPLIHHESQRQINVLHQNRNGLFDGPSIVCYDAALVVEYGRHHLFRPLVVAHCDQETQIQRLMKRGTGHGPLTREEAMDRIASQLPMEEKIKMADYLVDTSSSIEHSIDQTIQIIEKIRQ